MNDQDFAKRHGLSAKELAFVTAYPKSFNGTAAARDAGYAEKSAHVAASRLLSKDKVQGALIEITAGAVAEAGLSVQEIINGYRREAAGDFTPKQGTDTTSAARTAALTGLAKIAGAFTEDRPNPLAGLSSEQLIGRIEAMLRQSQPDVLHRLRGVIDEALGKSDEGMNNDGDCKA